MGFDNQIPERLAEAAHEIYCAGLRARVETNAALVPYAELPEQLREQNRDNVRDISNKLAQIGYRLQPMRGKQPSFDLPSRDLEKLAEMEHHRWVTAKIKDGWRYAPKTDHAKKRHNALLPWHKLTNTDHEQLFSPIELAVMGSDVLSEEEKEKDRDLVLGIPRILARAGYAIVKSTEDPPRND